jgi:hypothetical protein
MGLRNQSTLISLQPLLTCSHSDSFLTFSFPPFHFSPSLSLAWLPQWLPWNPCSTREGQETVPGYPHHPVSNTNIKFSGYRRVTGNGLLSMYFHRFEMPYNIWCDGCKNHIGMGKLSLPFSVFQQVAIRFPFSET